MIDPAVERQYSDTKELLALWNTFHQFFTIGVKGESITPEKENQFLELKSRIAMIHDSFMDALESNQNVGQEVLGIITRAITLKHLGRLSTADVKKLEIEWHEAYLLLNDTVALLEQKRRELDEINEGQYKAKQAASVARQKAGKFFGSFYFKLTAIIVAVLFATVGVQTLGIYDYDDLGKIAALKTPYNWGKAAVRATWNPDSPWPTIDSMHRLAYGSWPEGIKEPKRGEMDKETAIKTIARRAQEVGVGQAVYNELEKAVEYKGEMAERQRSADIHIHTFRFANADQAKALEKTWEDTRSRFSGAGQTPQAIDNMGMVRNVNIVTVIYSRDTENKKRMVKDVYGKKA